MDGECSERKFYNFPRNFSKAIPFSEIFEGRSVIFSIDKMSNESLRVREIPLISWRTATCNNRKNRCAALQSSWKLQTRSWNSGKSLKIVLKVKQKKTRISSSKTLLDSRCRHYLNLTCRTLAVQSISDVSATVFGGNYDLLLNVMSNDGVL